MKKKRNLMYFLILFILYLFFCFMVLMTLSSKQTKIDELKQKTIDLEKKLQNYENNNEELKSENEQLYNMLNQSMEANRLNVITVLDYIEPLKDLDKLEYFKNYKQVIFNNSNLIDPPETIYDIYSTEEIYVMLKCIETETYQCPFDAKVNVACVILNRINHNKFPSNPIDVVTSPNQFAYYRKEISDSTVLALEYAFMIEDTTNGSIGFRSDKLVDGWNGWEYVFTDGKHYFYKIKEKE